jgi:hypothetical protein
MPDTQACGLLAAKLLRSLGLRPDFQTHRPAACSQLGPAARFPDTQACGLLAAWACGPIFMPDTQACGPFSPQPLRPADPAALLRSWAADGPAARPVPHSARHLGLRPNLHARHTGLRPVLTADTQACGPMSMPDTQACGPDVRRVPVCPARVSAKCKP